MLPYRQGAAATAIGVGLWAFLCAAACAASSPKRPAKELRSAQAERHYQAGVGFYVTGDHPRALAAFREALILDPADVSVRAAIDRIVVERGGPAPLAPAPPRDRSMAAELGEKIDDYLIVAAPRYLRFERTLGDAWAGQGTLAAMSGRVAQMLVERKFALAKGRTFVKERELRALVRRLPVVLA